MGIFSRRALGLNWPAGLLLLWLLALGLAFIGLGSAPLRDWDEGIVARVALELANSPWPQHLLPTYWGDAYRNKPPGLHGLIALLIRFWRLLGGQGIFNEVRGPNRSMRRPWIKRRKAQLEN